MKSYGGDDPATYAEQQKKRGRKNDPRTMKRIIQAFSSYRYEVLTILVAILVTTLLGLVPSILISRIFDDAIGKGNAPLLLIYVAIMAAALILSSIIAVGQAYLSNKVGQSVMYDFRNKLYQHLQSMPLSFFTGTRTGEIQSRLSNDVSGVEGAVTNTATSLISDLSIIVSTIIAMIVVSPILTLITLGLFPLFAWITYKVGNVRRRMGKETQQSMASLTAQMEETLSVSGILLVKVFGQQKRAQTQFQHENKTLADLTLRQLMIGRLLFIIIGSFFSLTPILVYLIAGTQIIQHVSVLGSTMTIGMMAAFTSLQFRLFFPLGELSSLQVEFQGALALFDRIFEYLDLPITIQDKPGARHLTPAKVRGEVTFRNVTFTYRQDEYSILTGFDETNVPDDDNSVSDEDDGVPDRSGDPRPTLNNISFTIKPGQLAALVGPSGAGKTTMTYMLPRLYDVDSGAVQIDGINVKDIAQTSLGELIGVVTQETYLFHASIRENLLYARPDATEREMVFAAGAAAIHDRIMELENGYDTLVGERGYKLSGGEKQRLAIARVILKNPRLLILDEATSALDTRSERLIQTALEMLMEGRTTLAIAHRLSTILAADIILVVNKGEIVERGTHQQLLALGGLYAQLYHEQFSQPSAVIGQGQGAVSTAPARKEPAIVGTGSAPGTTPTAPVRLPTKRSNGSTQQTVPAIETQTAYLQLPEMTMQKKTVSPLRKPPIRIASKEDVLSIAYLRPGVREIFTPPSGDNTGL
jgi:ATP-binding cassette subfamily B protein